MSTLLPTLPDPITERLYTAYLSGARICTDTRKLVSGDLFVALKGDQFNGNLFAARALEAGAVLAVTDEDTKSDPDKTIRVPNALHALQALALHHRRTLDIPVLAITGSNGKTTTKELIHAVLSKRYHTSTTEGNLNNHIGIPLTLLKISPEAEIAVVEMGANHQQEIASYCSYTLPSHGLITNCGKAHLEGFDGIEGVRKGKGELFEYLKKAQGQIFACTDFDYLETMVAGYEPTVWYGTGKGVVQGHAIEHENLLQVNVTAGFQEPLHLKTQLVGTYNLYNVLAALTVGRHFGVSPTEMVAAIENYRPDNSRSQLVIKGSTQYILDAYNANPSSMKLAIENFARFGADRKIVLLGGMMEMGTESLAEHAHLIDLLQTQSFDEVALVGGDFAHVPHPYIYFQSSAEAGNWLRNQNLSETAVLIKGSRSMKMEKVLE